MELQSEGRRTILPPPPSPSRALFGHANALWYGVAALGRRGVGGLAATARRGLTFVRARWAPAPLPGATSVPPPRMSELLARLPRQYPPRPDPKPHAPITEAVTLVG